MNQLRVGWKIDSLCSIRCNWLLLLTCFLGLVICCVFSEYVVASYASLAIITLFFIYIVYEKPTMLIMFPFVLLCWGDIVGLASIELLPSFYH